MKYTKLLLIVLLSFSVNTIIVQAGSLNNNEAAIVNVAKSEFEVDGMKYKLADTYVSGLVSYLSKDGIELNQEEADKTISMIYAYKSQGIEEGYLVPVGNTSTAKEDNRAQPPNTTEEKKSYSDKTDNQSTANTDTDHNKVSTKEEANPVIKQESNIENTVTPQNKVIQQKTTDNQTKEKIKNKTKAVKNNNRKEDNQKDYFINTLNKSNNLNNSQREGIAIGFIGILMIAIYLIMKYKRFSRKY